MRFPWFADIDANRLPLGKETWFGKPGCLATGHTVTSFKQANCHTLAVTDLDSRAANEIPFHRALTVSTYGQWRHSRQRNMLSIMGTDTLYIRAPRHLETHVLSATPR